jgi:hypothetical protein
MTLSPSFALTMRMRHVPLQVKWNTARSGGCCARRRPERLKGAAAALTRGETAET